MNNVDTAEIAKFDRLADHWWNSSGAFGALHRINPLRLEYIEPIIEVFDVFFDKWCRSS